MAKTKRGNPAKSRALSSKQRGRGLKKIATAVEITAAADLPEDPKSMTRPEKLSAIGQFEETLSRGDAALVEGVRLILESQREDRKAGLNTWSVELSDPDFPRAVEDLDESQKDRDQKLLDGIQKALAVSRKKTVRVAKKHKNTH
jgi:hypothetical protein